MVLVVVVMSLLFVGLVGVAFGNGGVMFGIVTGGRAIVVVVGGGDTALVGFIVLVSVTGGSGSVVFS